ncbi:MAG: hypothetical protein ABI548_05480 [Polyangiaceae bacterium]
MSRPSVAELGVLFGLFELKLKLRRVDALGLGDERLPKKMNNAPLRAS